MKIAFCRYICINFPNTRKKPSELDNLLNGVFPFKEKINIQKSDSVIDLLYWFVIQFDVSIKEQPICMQFNFE